MERFLSQCEYFLVFRRLTESLVPYCFFIYIDNVTSCMKSQNAHDVLYADNLLYKAISDPQDFVDLQHDVSTIEQWSAKTITPQ